MTYERDEDKVRAYQRRYYEKNHERVRASVRRRLAERRAKGQLKHPTWDPDQSAAARVEPVMSYEEIAAELGISKARVGQIVERALRKLKARYPRLRELIK